MITPASWLERTKKPIPNRRESKDGHELIASAIWQERTKQKPFPNKKESPDGHELITPAIWQERTKQKPVPDTREPSNGHTTTTAGMQLYDRRPASSRSKGLNAVT